MSSTPTLRLAASAPKPTDTSKLTGHQRLAALLATICGNDDPLNRDLWKVTDWQPLFADKAEIMEALANVREDGQENLAVACCLAAMTPDKMRGFVAQMGGGVDEAVQCLETLHEYRERVISLEAMIGAAFARLFAVSHEIHGGGPRPALAVVGG